MVLADAALLVVVLVAVAGLVLVVVSAIKIGKEIYLELRQVIGRPSPSSADAEDTARAAAVTERLARRAGVPAPGVRVVAMLGRPAPGPARSSVGTGGLAITRCWPRRPVRIDIARAALTEVSPAALEHLVAHELAHVIECRTTANKVRQAAWVLGFLLVTLPPAARAVATRSIPLIAVTAVAALLYLLVRMHWQRREELDADRFAIALTHDIVGPEQLMAFYEAQEPSTPPTTRRGVRRALSVLERRWLATHPEPEQRLAAMRRHWCRVSASEPVRGGSGSAAHE